MSAAPTAVPPMVAAVPMTLTASPISAFEKHMSFRNGFTIVPAALSPNLYSTRKAATVSACGRPK